MKVLIVGSGGREHALAWKMKQSSKVDQVFVAPGNDGMSTHFDVTPLETHDEIISFVKEQNIDLTFVGQEVYLVNGLADQMIAAGCNVVGPTAAAAALEGSKEFSKDFMKRHHIPTAAYGTFTELKKAQNYLETLHPPYVIKANALAAGKGVVICHDLESALAALEPMLSGEAFEGAGKTVVIEEFLTGEEASYFVMTDGKDFVSFPSCQDYKRIGELDTGPNTGGMGAYSPAPVVTPAIENKIINNIVKPTIEGMAQEGNPYKGVIYIGLMIDNDEPKVIEYNCRFGDPECQPLMMRLKSDLMSLSLAVVNETLNEEQVEWDDRPAACIMLASGGYPEKYEKGKIISGIEASSSLGNNLSQGGLPPTSIIFHSGTKREGPIFRTNGGRVLGVTSLGDTLEEALSKTYQTIQKIHWDGMVYRRDIGIKGLMYYQDNRPKVSVGIVIGSQSDLEIAKKATAILEKFNVGYRLCISSAHRTPERTRCFISETEAEGAQVFIAMAGMAAHLPGVVAAETTKPVIGVPIVSTLDGMDSLLAIAQMPPGVPVATMATNGSVNAAILAVQILSLNYTDLRAHLKLYKMEMSQKVELSHKNAGLDTTH